MTTIRRLLTRMMRLLVTASDTGPWWHRDQWNPVEDNRIPLRDHEPMGRYSVRFDRIGTRWLRRGLQWHCKVGLDTGVLSWSTVHRRIVAVHEFARAHLARFKVPRYIEVVAELPHTATDRLAKHKLSRERNDAEVDFEAGR